MCFLNSIVAQFARVLHMFLKAFRCAIAQAKKEKIEDFPGQVGRLGRSTEIKKMQKPDLVAVLGDVEKTLDLTSKQVREISKAIVSAASLKKGLTGGTVVLSDTS
jgi:hypothetical protein